MNKEQQMVLEFHKEFDIKIATKPQMLDQETSKLRYMLFAEEVEEFKQACFDQSIIGVIDAIADILYVAYGAAISLGVDMESIFAEVHRSNMTKVGGHKDKFGKWIKPSTYELPKLQEELLKQGW